MKFQLFDLLDHAELVVINGRDVTHFDQIDETYRCEALNVDYYFAPQVVDVVGHQIKVVDLESECEVLIKFWQKTPMTEADFEGNLLVVA